MRERPINLRAWEVRAWLDGRLSQIRRPVKPQPNRYWLDERERAEMVCPLGAPGDVLWGREAWRTEGHFDHLPPRDLDPTMRATPIQYEAGPHDHTMIFGILLRSSTHMPRWASRITWRIKSVRVERVQDISESDAMACGAPSADLPSGRECIFPHQGTYRWGFRLLWERHYGPGSWDANPWVWVLEIEGA